MGNVHTVVQGEHLSGIAKKYGFASYKTIWDHAQNAEVKKKRQNPNVIFPGDRLFIPDKEVKDESGGTEKRHRFQVKAEKLTLRLVLEDLYGKPIANAQCELRVENEVFTLTTSGQGKIEQDIKPTDERAFLTIKDPQTPVNEIQIPVMIGHLDPVEEVSGQKTRLANLGYYAGRIDGQDDPAFRLAVEEFQCEHGLTVDGVCGPKTQAKLKSVHGC